jgi:hypothetical protein
MRANPQADWTIADVERVCGHGIDDHAAAPWLTLYGTDPKSAETLTVPARRPIRAVYIRALLGLVDRFRKGKDGS